MATDDIWFLRARLKIRQLLLLVALAEEGNIRRAAKTLNMTQPAASKLLKDLEDALGVSLFDRLPRGMRVNWYGDTMIRHARAALSTICQAHNELQAAKIGQFGQVHIGAITAPGLVMVPQAIDGLISTHPHLQISVQIEPSNLLVERLVRGKLDIVVGRLAPDSHSAALRYESVGEELIVAAARIDHPLLSRGGLSISDLMTCRWILPPAGSALRHRFDLMVQELNLAAPLNSIETSSLLLSTKMLQQSDMVTLMAAEVAHYYANHSLLSVLPVTLSCQMESFGLITSRERALSLAAKTVLSHLKQSASAIYGSAFAPGAP
jgi:DNA-binding transcriptional LysR family regulator